ncbi:MarC family protein [Shigella flexneri]
MGKPTQLRRNYAAGGQGWVEQYLRLMGFLLVCMGVQFIINGILEIIKRIIKEAVMAFQLCVCSSSVTGQRRNIMIDQINAAKAGTAPT